MNDIDRFLNAQSEQTRRSYRWFLVRMDSWMEKQGIDPVDLDADLLNTWLDSEAQWGSSTRRIAICAARAFYRWWRGSEHPVLEAKLRRAKAAPQRVLNPKQAIRLLAEFDPSTPIGARDLAMVSLMLDTGLRESEVCRLELRRLNLDENSLTVLVKGGIWGRAVYSDITREHLQRWIEMREDVRGKHNPNHPPPEVFLSSTGKPLTASGLRKFFQRLSKRVGFQVGAHDLRRTFATMATRAGAPTRVLMAAGRWSNLAQLETYTREVTADDMKPWFPVRTLAGE